MFRDIILREDKINEVVKFYIKKKVLWNSKKGKYEKVLKKWCGDSNGTPVKGFKIDAKKRKCKKLTSKEVRNNEIASKKRIKTNKKLATKHQKDAIKRKAKRASNLLDV